MWAVGLSVQAMMRKVCVDLAFCCAKIRENEIVAVQKVQNVGSNSKPFLSKLIRMPRRCSSDFLAVILQCLLLN